LPTNLLELNFWCEAMVVAKIDDEDIPNNAVYYLSDQSYTSLLYNKTPYCDRVGTEFKIRLVESIFKIAKN
jgi:hypothetical protein